MRVLIADDQPEVRSALRLLLEQEGEIAVVGEAGGAGSLLQTVQSLCPDVVLLDWELPGQDSALLLGELRHVCPRVRAVALSGRPEARGRALAAGAFAFASKGDPPERLIAILSTCRVQKEEHP